MFQFFLPWQYCINQGLFLVIHQKYFFMPFHNSIAYDSVFNEVNPFLLDKNNILQWHSCNFSGFESLLDVSSRLFFEVPTVQQFCYSSTTFLWWNISSDVITPQLPIFTSSVLLWPLIHFQHTWKRIMCSWTLMWKWMDLQRKAWINYVQDVFLTQIWCSQISVILLIVRFSQYILLYRIWQHCLFWWRQCSNNIDNLWSIQII